MKELKKNLNGSGMRIGIIQSRFNIKASEGLMEACVAQLIQQGVAEDEITLATVPSVRQIPLVLLTMSESKKIDAMIAIGSVAQVDFCNPEALSDESTRCVDEVQLECGVPIVNAILDAKASEQAIENIRAKGNGAALEAIEMVNLLRDLA